MTEIEQQRLALVKTNQATMVQVETLLVTEASKALSLAEQLDRDTLGGFLRGVVPGLVDKFGNVNATLAMKYYDEQRALAIEKRKLRDWRNASKREAAAKLKSQIYVASLPQFEPAKVAEPIIGYAMATYVASDNFAPVREAVVGAMTRAVGSYNRDTILYNAGLDSDVVGVQRVAEPGACSFCATVAFQSGVWHAHAERVSSYAIDFHSHCKCSIETLYAGDKPFRPAHYDQLERDYTKAAEVVGTSDTKRLLTEMRRQTGRK